MIFYVGLHLPNKAIRIDRSFISANRLWNQKAPILVNEWVMDSGAFTEISTHGRYRSSAEDYAEVIRRFSRSGDLKAAVAQDYMCEAHILEKTGMTIPQHQGLTIERYDGLLACDVAGIPIMPVLQGFQPDDYVRHLRDYGDRLKPNMWVGVGSVCKRQGSPKAILAILKAIHQERPDLRLHGFGVKLTSLKNREVCNHLYSADSMAWSFAARKAREDSHDIWAALEYEEKVLAATGAEPGDFARWFASKKAA